MTTTDPRPAILEPTPNAASLAGPDPLNDHRPFDTQRSVVVEGQTSPQANHQPAPIARSLAGSSIETTRPATGLPTPKASPLAGSDPLNSHGFVDAHGRPAVEGQTSPQARGATTPRHGPLAGSSTSHSHSAADTHICGAVAVNTPGSHSSSDAHEGPAAGGTGPGQPTARDASTPNVGALLADPLLALAADILDDLEKVRIANENRYRQLTRSDTDSDGETRGFGLDQAHPDVARLAALVAMLAAAEHQAALNLGRLMRAHPLGPWVKNAAGVGEKQGARLIAAIGDPYIRPEIERADGIVEPSRPRTVGELWAFCGYHVIRTPASSQPNRDAQMGFAAGGPDSHPGHSRLDTQEINAGVAPKRRKGQHANWSPTAKMRAYLVAEKCMQTGKATSTPYRQVYDTARTHYAQATHQVPCERCGPKGKPAQPGSPLSDGHKHARALRKVAKEILKDLWREARRIHHDNDL
jgi:hypothetical protein